MVIVGGITCCGGVCEWNGMVNVVIMKFYYKWGHALRSNSIGGGSALVGVGLVWHT